MPAVKPKETASRNRPRTRSEIKADHADEARERNRMAVLTGLCLAGLIAGIVLEHLGVKFAITVTAFVVAYLAGGWYSTRGAILELREGSVNVDLLMVAAAGGAAVVGQWAEGAILLFLFSLSGTLEKFILGRTRRAIESLMELAPEEARLIRDGSEVMVPVEDLHPGDLVRVRPGERMPADGVIQEGETSINQAILTGESVPVDRGVGDDVFAATLNQQGALVVKVTRHAGETTLARIVQLVEEAQGSKAQSEKFTAWFGEKYTLAVLGLSTLTMLVPWLMLGETFSHAFYRAMTVLVVASPCAVVISIPAAILAAISRGAKAGVLFKGGVHLEQLAEIKAIAFDKTGTLTVGKPSVTDLLVFNGTSEEELLQTAASAEQHSEHPIAAAILSRARDDGHRLDESDSFKAVVGNGIKARVRSTEVLIGQPGFLRKEGVAFPETFDENFGRLASEGKTVMAVAGGGKLLGMIAVADTLREHADEAVAALKQQGVTGLVMLTGDHEQVARAIAGRLGLSYHAELMPEDKLRCIGDIRAEHGPVAMIGDGINDAPALAAADLGISLGGSGTHVALETADLVLMKDDLRQLAYGLALSRQAVRIIRQNLAFAFTVMLGLLGVAYFGELRLPLAVVGHEGSTVLVILNGLRLLAFRGQGASRT